MAPDLPLQQSPVFQLWEPAPLILQPDPKEQHVLVRRAPSENQGYLPRCLEQSTYPPMDFSAPGLWLLRAGEPGVCLGSARACKALTSYR